MGLLSSSCHFASESIPENYFRASSEATLLLPSLLLSCEELFNDDGLLRDCGLCSYCKIIVQVVAVSGDIYPRFHLLEIYVRSGDRPLKSEVLRQSFVDSCSSVSARDNLCFVRSHDLCFSSA